jgi:hypothetical protein
LFLMTTSPGLRRPAGRYDAPRSLSPAARVGAGLLLVAALLGFAFVGYRHYAHGRAPFTNTGYAVQSDSSVLVRFTVVVEAHETVRCLLQARDADNVEVGSAVVRVTSGSSRAVAREDTVSTKRRAVAAEVLSCRPA